MRVLKLLVFCGLILLQASACDQSNKSDRSTAKHEEATRAYASAPRYRDPDGQTFHGYACTDGCAGHRAGYEWAEKRGISDPDDCSGRSKSFIEGCWAYAGKSGGEQ